jgi:uncharacterized membrane protein
MAQTVVGLFDDRDEAQRAVRDLLDHAFPTEKISIITTDPDGEFIRQPVTADPGNKSNQGVAVGAASGAVVGGIFGLLVGAGILLFPPLGVIAAGPVVATLAGAGVGALGGGILGGLIGLGIPKDQVQTYAEAIRRGGVVVAVQVNEADMTRANEIMKKHNAVDISQRAAYYQSQGFTQYDPNERPYTPAEIAAERERVRSQYSSMNAPVVGSRAPQVATTTMVEDTVVRNRYDQSGNQGLAYQQWEPAYRYGWQLAQNPQFQGFSQGEPTIRQMWEQSNPGTYQLYRDAIHSGFEDAFARRTGPKMM